MPPLQLTEDDLTYILKRCLTWVGIDDSGYAQKSFRIGMACTVLANLSKLGDGLGYTDSGLEYVGMAGRWADLE